MDSTLTYSLQPTLIYSIWQATSFDILHFLSKNYKLEHSEYFMRPICIYTIIVSFIVTFFKNYLKIKVITRLHE